MTLTLSATVLAVNNHQATVALSESSKRCQNCHAGCGKYKNTLYPFKKPIKLTNHQYQTGQQLLIRLDEVTLRRVFLLKAALPFIAFIGVMLLLIPISELMAFLVALLAGLVTLLLTSKACEQWLLKTIEVLPVSQPR